ncbi:hypothetical protein JCGZ_16084 [Jatropha curcas]|uniref:Receptor-like serine/threonine-protein kinase n=2 Tax=Jatropha curcas TaxID=180498 RepID=A0A067KZS2_JATCU|nr:putative receptor protein kinase ZmPK1 isoform X2 [Jatropha curcas]XP_012068282.1 putative receptor protein kinase ZmPK1 isoform X2 [Jatropha curcas]XP_012068283.1 putative receptor protein kinase ZmPK1 isoform X2 [Jatropha curcas]XP_020533672.1 putative receptor protein kinase ZmPK1 isoform X2 [Jatropha curcas]KDP41677.1 hypothetical protein JCGZ_16084 [Jatropha curcas]
MANRDFSVNGKRSKLSLLETGDLILSDAGQSIAWSTDTFSLSSTELRLYDNGNLVLQNTEGVLWQSFDSPTDTLLPSQPLTRNTQLVSSRSRANFSSGYYKMIFDSYKILILLYDGPKLSSVYWPYAWLRSFEGGRVRSNNSRTASFDSLGRFTSSDNFSFISADYGVRIQRRLTVDYDGNARLYSRKEDSPTWVVSWQAKSQLCEIHGICGQNSTCSYDPVSGNKCSCLPGYKRRNTADWSDGCEPEYNLSCDNETAGFMKLRHVEIYHNDLGSFPNVSLEMCKKICLQSCNCKGFQYRHIENSITPSCYPKSIMANGQRTPSFSGDFYVKVPKSSLFSNMEVVSGISDFKLNCSIEPVKPLNRVYSEERENGTLKFMLWFACGLGGIEIIGIFLVTCFLMKSQKDSNKATQNYHSIAAGFKRFTYSELKRATRNFSEEIGRGGGGVVYKGTLWNGQVAAIKRLDITNQGEAEFLAEVSIIGRLNHMNLIGMWGYCVEGKHRLLVYDYMENGSLAKNLSLKALDWKKRFDIALGTARGLAYLHDECCEWILHCDVKPHNILLDSNYQPKVADFGLSKLQDRGEVVNHSNFSKIRGTRGYMAPEWVINLPITSKVDVYSYGIVVLELVTGKSPVMEVSGQIDNKRLVASVREKKNRADGKASWFEEIIDPLLKGEYDEVKMEILVQVALQCVEEDRDARPTMSRVVEMLLRLENDY